MSNWRWEDKKVFVAGHRGMVGSAITNVLEKAGATVLKAGRDILNLTDQASVQDYFAGNKIEAVFLAAAKVGGIHANNEYPAEFIYKNLMIQNNVIDSACRNGVARLMFLGSSCIYPKYSSQPMEESSLLTGVLEPTNEPYAIAKIAGIKMCESYNRQYGTDFRSVMPTNLYGQNDNFHPENSHVIPALIGRFHDAHVNSLDKVTIWGTGAPKREFLHVNDMADACVHLLGIEKDSYWDCVPLRQSHVNVGTGEDVSIRELAELIAKVIGYEGGIDFDVSKPDGTPRKLLDVSLAGKLGWRHRIELEDGLMETYEWFKANQSAIRH